MTLTRSGSEVAEYFALLGDESVCELDGSPLRARYNVAPSQPVVTIVQTPERGRRPEWKQWGLVPSWAKDAKMGGRLFNARSETVATKPSFRSAFKRRRCLVASDGFYEWTPRNRGHEPFLLQPVAGPLFGFAGLYDEWLGPGGEVIESCTVLTTEANADLAAIHHRMPVILAPQDFETWLEPESGGDRLMPLLAPAAAGTLSCRPVGRYVNDPRHDDEGCWRPPPTAEQADLFELDGGAFTP